MAGPRGVSASLLVSLRRGPFLAEARCSLLGHTPGCSFPSLALSASALLSRVCCVLLSDVSEHTRSLGFPEGPPPTCWEG